jgi:hypothetical protein
MSVSLTFRRLARRRARGFTLVELMVALSGGLFLSVIVFTLARDTGRFYQRESRIANATLGGIVGFERLKRDIARAGYLASPNVTMDPMVCGRPDGSWPQQLRRLSSVRINANGSPVGSNADIVANGVSPDEIILAGSYSATDEYPVEGTSSQLVIQDAGSGAMARLGYLKLTDATEQADLLETVFGVGRAVRFLDKTTGRAYFSSVQSVTGGASPRITLSSALYGSTSACPLPGHVVGSLSVINFVRYRIEELAPDTGGAFESLFAASRGEGVAPPGEATRTELVRQELDVDGDPIDGTLELIAEYAVDLDFEIGAVVNGAISELGPAAWGTIFAINADNVGTPQRVRTVRARLSVRSREADREAPIDGGLYRFRLGSNQYARVRTFQADIALPNQLGVEW